MVPHALERLAALAGLCILSAPVVMAAETPSLDPWAKVPKLSTACYSSQDKFGAETTAAIAAMNQEMTRQEEVNRGFVTYLNNLAQTEKQKRMKSYATQHPKDLMKLIQDAQVQAAANEGKVATDHANEEKLDADLKELQTKYDTALQKAEGPFNERLKSIGKCGNPQACEEVKVLTEKLNAEYEKLCPEWWGAAGAFHAWLGRYKEHLLHDHVPYTDEVENMKPVQYKILGVPGTDSFRSTVSMQAVVDYMKKAEAVLGQRRAAPMQ